MIDLRPRFLPDAEVAKEWGAGGAFLSKLILRGFRVPPTAAWGATQVHGWLESLSAYKPAVESWRLWGNPYSQTWEPVPAAVGLLADLRDQILSAPMPFHFAKGVTTLREMLCGGQVWPLQLQSANDYSAPIENPQPYDVWCAFRELMALQFSLERASLRLEKKEDPRGLRYPVLIQPVLRAEVGDLPPAALEDLRAHQKVFKDLELNWIWDGEQIWFPSARAKAVVPKRTGSDLALDSMIQEFLRDAGPELKRRYGLHVEGLQQTDLRGLRIQPRFSFAVLAKTAKALLRPVAEFRLAKRRAELEAPFAALTKEFEHSHDRDERDIEAWIQGWRETHSIETLEQRFAEIRTNARRPLIRGLAAYLIRQSLAEALTPFAQRDGRKQVANVAPVEVALKMASRLTHLVDAHRAIADSLRTAARRSLLSGGDALVRKQFLRTREDAYWLKISELLEAFGSDAMTVRFLVERRRADAAAVIPAGLTQDSNRLRASLLRSEVNAT